MKTLFRHPVFSASQLAIALSILIAIPTNLHSAVLEEIVVTAQKREENLQDVGVSITAFSGEQTEILGWDNTLDVAAQTPGLITTSNTGDPANLALFSLRGVAQIDYGEGQEAPVAIYNDEVYLSAPGSAGAPIFDMQRIEVLRGPQGTLYGRNATGGLIHFVSNRPTEEFEAGVNLTLAEFGQLGVTAFASGALSDRVNGRLAVYHNKDDGYVKNISGPDLRADNTQSFRGIIDYETDTSQFTAIVRGTLVDTRGGVFHAVASTTNADGLGIICQSVAECYAADAGGNFGLFDPDADVLGTGAALGNGLDDGIGDELEGSYNLANGGVDRDSLGITSIYKREIGNLNLTSVTDYSTSNKNYLEEDDSTIANYAVYNSGADIKQFSQEIRVDAETDSSKWVVGAYYLNIDDDYFGAFQFPYYGNYKPRFDATIKTRTWSVFGQSEFDLDDQLTLTAGLRWTNDNKDLDVQLIECVDFVPQPCVPLVSTTAQEQADRLTRLFAVPGQFADGEPRSLSRQDGELSGKVQLEWRPSDEQLYYFGISRGIKGGGFNTPSDGLITDEQIPYDPEILLAYELGAKLTLEDWGRLNASIFYYDYDDYQGFYFLNTTSVFVNSKAKFLGGEIELVLTPGEGWDIILGTSLLSTEVNNVSAGIIDQDAPLAPKFTANGVIRKQWELDKGAIAGQVSAFYTGEQYFNVLNSDTTKGGDYALVDASLTYYSENDQWELGAFINNIADERPITFSYDISGFGRYTIQVIGPPRWAGVKVKYHF